MWGGMEHLKNKKLQQKYFFNNNLKKIFQWPTTQVGKNHASSQLFFQLFIHKISKNNNENVKLWMCETR